MPRLVDAQNVVITSAGYALVKYLYELPDPIPELNSMGNFYRRSHFHKATQRKIDQLVENGPLPNPGDVIDFEDAGRTLSLKITQVVIDYHPSDKTIELMRVDEAITENRRWKNSRKKISNDDKS